MAHVIGLGGLKGSGKDAFGNYLPGKWKIIGMSDPLLESMIALNPIIDNHGTRFYDEYTNTYNCDYVAIKKGNPEVRALLQRLGTDVVRNIIDTNAWTNIAERRIKELTSQGYNVAVSGIRFPNELAMIKNFGGHAVWVERNLEATDTHPSENSLTAQNFDHIIINDGTLEELEHKAHQFINTIKS